MPQSGSIGSYPGIAISSFLGLIAVALTLAGPCVGAENPGFVVHSRKACCVVVVPDDATGGETHAARELVDHVKQMTGVELTQMPEREYDPTKTRCIAIGRTDLSRRYAADYELAKLGDDGYRIFTRNGNAFFVGGRKRAAMYAVYQYLESLGMRWYSPEYTVIPKLDAIAMPAAAEPVEYVPPFWYRCQWWNNGATLEWLARMRLNGNTGQTPQIPDSMGGCVIPMHGCHSYGILVPPDLHFDKHPEWFALNADGTRSRNEYCLTNVALRDFVTSRVLTDLRASGGAVENYWVSQNDGGLSGCFCERCAAERAAHGGKDRWSANTIPFANSIALSVKRHFPRVRIKTLAYSYTKEPPENMKAEDNVLIEVCGNFGKPDGVQEKSVQSWFRVARNISVYTYGGSNYGYWWPFPNLRELGMQYPWARESGVSAIYVQGTALGKGSGLVDLRAYLTARMAWDPSRDVDVEIVDFCRGFYGPGAAPIIEYIQGYSEFVKKYKLPLYDGWGDGEAWRAWVTSAPMEHGEALFQKALAATEGEKNAVYRKHVRRAYLEVLWGTVMLSVKPGADSPPVCLPDVDCKDVRARAQLFEEIMRENGYDKLAENREYLAGKDFPPPVEP